MTTKPPRKRSSSSPPAKASELSEESIRYELERRVRITEAFHKTCFDKQLAFIKDPSRKKILFTPRRSGKTHAIGKLLLITALLYPGSKLLYCGVTKTSAENCIWEKPLKKDLHDFGIKYNYDSATKVIRLQNGSQITIFGLDCTPKEMDKVLGGQYRLMVIDECQSQTQDIERAVKDKFWPCLMDLGGTVVLAGVPGEKLGANYWFTQTGGDAVTDADHLKRRIGWSLHSWTMPENPHMAEQFARDCREFAEASPFYQEEPTFRREYLGQWVLDLGSLVYHYQAERNLLDSSKPEQVQLIASLQRGKGESKWTYLLGVDLGFVDATAFVVVAYNKTDRELYIVESKKISQTTFDGIGAHLLAYQARYNFIRVVVDSGGGGSKILAESFRDKYRLPIISADKREKDTQIGRVNSALITGEIKLVPNTNDELIREWQELTLDPKKLKEGVMAETKDGINHLCDAARYALRDAFTNHYATEIKPIPDFIDQVLAHQRRQNDRLTNDPDDDEDQDFYILSRLRNRR